MKNVVLWVVGGVVLTGIAVCGLGYKALEGFGDTISTLSVDPALRKDAETKMGLRFPPFAHATYYRGNSFGPDGMVQIKLLMNSTELKSFLGQPTLKKASWEEHIPDQGHFTDEKDGTEWKPSRVKKGREAQIDLPNAKYLNVLIDDTSATEKEVYLMWFET